MIEQGEDIACLDLFALVHHHHSVGDFRHDPHVMGDEQQRHTELALQAAHQSQHLCLHGDVEGCRWFIGNQQAWATGQSHCDHDPLAHAARHLERIAVELTCRLGDAHAFQHPPRLFACCTAVHVLVEFDRLGDLVADTQDRIERGHRFLEHHRDLGAAEVAHCIRCFAREVANGAGAVAEADAASIDPAAGMVDQTRDCQRGHGLA